MVVEAGQIAHRRVAGLLEAVDVLAGPGRALGRVVDEVVDDERVRQLLGQNRRDPNRQVERRALGLEVVERVKERQVGLGDRLVDPLLAVGPHPRLACVGQMAVQDERERAGLRHRFLLRQ
jgi:hypothetical protein